MALYVLLLFYYPHALFFFIKVRYSNVLNEIAGNSALTMMTLPSFPSVSPFLTLPCPLCYDMRRCFVLFFFCFFYSWVVGREVAEREEKRQTKRQGPNGHKEIAYIWTRTTTHSNK
ncbi:hypothetical protein F5H01DRAFT_185836 [Linnemannia elongata]|nr:hypothetical protein F5H01DRAFT_185836 [Linnemannia elongata]